MPPLTAPNRFQKIDQELLEAFATSIHLRIGHAQT
jgi:hypothetical protein